MNLSLLFCSVILMFTSVVKGESQKIHLSSLNRRYLNRFIGEDKREIKTRPIYLFAVLSAHPLILRLRFVFGFSLARWFTSYSLICSLLDSFVQFNCTTTTRKSDVTIFLPSLLRSWPRKGCCSWNDSHTYEIKHRRTTPPRVFVPLGILSRRIPCPVFEVIDPFSCVWRSLAPSGFNKMSALLFWTNW